MTDKFQNKYRIPSARWQNWDYRWAGAYFITICMKDHALLLGNIANKQMHLSQAGVLADVFWHEITKHVNHVELGPFVVMPNHVHGILILNKDGSDNLILPNNDDKSIGQRRFQHPGRNSVSTIIGSYKSVVSSHAHRLGFPFQWQSRFHDHVIRDAEEYQRISDYITDNVAKWEEDKFHPEYELHCGINNRQLH
jgi:REP element-mobilizing transposase RayT